MASDYKDLARSATSLPVSKIDCYVEVRGQFLKEPVLISWRDVVGLTIRSSMEFAGDGLRFKGSGRKM
jgi:hypothetical protein